MLSKKGSASGTLGRQEAEERGNDLQQGLYSSDEVKIKVGVEFLALLGMLKGAGSGRRKFTPARCGEGLPHGPVLRPAARGSLRQPGLGS